MIEPNNSITPPPSNSTGEPPQEPPAVNPTDPAVASPSIPNEPPVAKIADKPAWLFDDNLYDMKTGLKVDELGKTAKELFDYRAGVEKANAARAADTPASPADYKVGFTDDFKLPEGVRIDEAGWEWQALRDIGAERGLTQSEFKAEATKYVKAKLAAEQTARAWGDKQFETALGSNWSERVEANNKWLQGFFGDQVGKELSAAKFTPNIQAAFEQIQKHFTSQGVVSLTSSGRDSGRADGKPEGWEKWSPMDQRTWQLNEQSKTKRA